MGDSIEIKVDDSTVGVALLVSNDYKSLEADRYLSSVHQDADKLEKLFKEFGYVVYKRQNVSDDKFGSYCRVLSNFDYPPSCARLVVYFSGHGRDGILEMQNGRTVDINKITMMFTPFVSANNRIGLMARMFFFDSCRGERTDYGRGIKFTDELRNEFEFLSRVPMEGNMLVAYACTPNYAAFHGSTGSRWTNCLVEALEKSTETDSLGTVLTMANGLLSKNYHCGCVQTATFTSSLRGYEVFLKKEASDRVKKCNAPRLLSVNDATDTTMDLSWMIPDMSSGNIVGYELEFSPVVTYSQIHPTLTATVSGLSPGTKYQFRVAAVTAEGRQPFSDNIYHNTTNEPPQPTMNSPAKEEILAVTFSHESAVKNLWKEYANLQNLPYETIKDQLKAMKVITDDEQKLIDSFDDKRRKMTEVLSIVIADLHMGQAEKYECFLKVMKESDDEFLKETATKLENEVNATLSTKEVLRKFYTRLIEKLPLSDKSFFHKAFQADLHPLNVATRMQAKPTNAEKVSYFLHHVVEPAADIYLPMLLEVMKDSQRFDVKELANDIEKAMTGQIFNCSDAAKLLKLKYAQLLNLSYSNMSGSLYANDVITQQEKLEIQQLIGKSQMERVLDIVIASLKSNQTAKYKGFLLAMESNEDITVNVIAQQLGGSDSVPG